MEHVPAEPTGESTQARWCQWAHRRIVALSNIRINGGRSEYTSGGVVLTPPESFETTEAESATVQFRVKSIEDEYLVCRNWDGLVEGGNDIKVAKPYMLRKSTYNGVTRGGFLYAYTSAQARTATRDSSSFTQTVFPEYAVNDVIYGALMDEDTVLIQSDSSIQYVDINADARAWATNLEICDNGTAKTLIAVGQAPA